MVGGAPIVLAYGELEERLELVESSLTPVSPHLEERLELLESLLSRDQEEELARSASIFCGE